MTRLLVHVEGQTEEMFVNEILDTHLCTHGFSKVSARIMGNARQRIQRGGVRTWASARKGIVNHLEGDERCIATTIVDYYGMPKTWPGRSEASELAFPENAESIENALASEVCEHMGTDFNPVRFVPYVMMHEFEAMLFSDCDKFAEGIGQPGLAPKFQAIRQKFATPEEIDDSPETAPSKRIESLVPGYQKPLLGILAALDIGLVAIRSECPHFHSWLTRLESIPTLLEA